MQKVGDVCENCRNRWEKKGKEPLVLQRSKGVTINKKIVVPICNHCDGYVLDMTPLEEA